MAAPSTDVALLRVSTRNIPEQERTPFWREVFARQVCRLEFEPLSEGPLDVDATLLALPGLSIGWCLSAKSARWSRTAELVKDGDDGFALITALSGKVTRFQRGQELAANPRRRRRHSQQRTRRHSISKARRPRRDGAVIGPDPARARS